MQTWIIQYRPPRIALLLVLLAALTQWLLPSLPLVTRPRPLVGGLVAAAGFSLMLGAWWQFRIARTAVCPTAPSTRLVSDGVFRLSRNPMYLGMIGMLGGVAVAQGGLPFYLAVIGYFSIIQFAFCPFEERKLRETFGEEYAAYRARVRRWL